MAWRIESLCNRDRVTRRGCLIAATLLLSLTACETDVRPTSAPDVATTVPEVTSTEPPEVPSVVGTWGLEEIIVDGEPMNLSPKLARFEEHPGVAAWIAFDDDRNVQGQLPCNGFLGEYVQHGAVVEWEVVKDAGLCVDEENIGMMEAELPMTALIWTPRVDIAIDEGGSELRIVAASATWPCQWTGSSCTEPTGAPQQRHEVVMVFARLED
jgi:hypothetical protein